MDKKNKRYSIELKKQVAEEYLNGERMSILVKKYGLRSDSQVIAWRDKYLAGDDFQDKRGGSRPHAMKRGCEAMDKDEYIKYLEMENDILKQLRSLNNNRVKSNTK